MPFSYFETSGSYSAMTTVLTCADLDDGLLAALLGRYEIIVEWIAPGMAIPGSYWGESEAGLIGDRLLVRDDTPVHSALHEAGHYICMDAARRAALHTDAGGEFIEENGVCYLQILLADDLPGLVERDCAPTWMPGATVFGWDRPAPGSSRMQKTPASG